MWSSNPLGSEELRLSSHEENSLSLGMFRSPFSRVVEFSQMFESEAYLTFGLDPFVSQKALRSEERR